MDRLKFFYSLVTLCLILQFKSCKDSKISNTESEISFLSSKGILLTTRIASFEELKTYIDIEYDTIGGSWVKLTQERNGFKLESLLSTGIKESDVMKARDAGFWSKFGLLFKSPYFISHRYDILRIWVLSRRRPLNYGGGDVAFYDLAVAMQNNINEVDRKQINLDDFSEKGFINTFNHVNSQAIITFLYSERLADFIADTHERNRLPELITGAFTLSQINDIHNGAVDNYIDLINNEWGQELGKYLQKKYDIDSKTIWTPELLCLVLNQIQSYYGWVLDIGFDPFRPTDTIITQFSMKINAVKGSVKGLR